MNAISQVLQIQSRIERLMLCALIITVCTLCGLYFYLLSASVVHVVFTKEAEENIHQVHSDIASLEATYMERQHSISMEVVRQQGYITDAKKIFLDRNQASVVTQR